MNIINDKLVLDTADLALFSPAAQKALALPEFGRASGLNSRTYKEVAETAFNQALANALEIWRATVSSDIKPLVEALAVSKDAGKVAQVEALIEQAKTVLNVKDETAAVLNPSAEKPVPK